MSVVTMIKEIKKIHPKDIVLVQIGVFCHAYGKDSYILSHIFGYKLKYIDQNLTTAGFPENAKSKVLARLEQNKINYIIVDRRNNYEIIEKNDNKNLNTYDEKFAESYEQSKLKLRIYNIANYLEDNLSKKEIKQKIQEIEKILVK